MRDYSVEDGRILVHAARYAIELQLMSPSFDEAMVSKSLDGYPEKAGVYVTLEHYPTHSVRGIAGFAKPTAPLGKLLVEAAVLASAGDGKFVPLSHREFDEMVVEVSIRSELEKRRKRTADTRKNEIKVGQDGVMVHYGFKSGLLLPTIAHRSKWGKERFLDEVCMAAGLEAQTWKRPEVSIFRFHARTFAEESPGGNVIELVAH